MRHTINRKTLTDKKEGRFIRSYWVGIAASILFIIMASYWWTGGTQQTIVHQTAYGEKINITLADGTGVTLNANSSLSYNLNQNRKVWIKGEAFFKVAKEETTKAKFWVHTPDLVIEVLGTEFNVNTQKAQTEVVLEEGKINLLYGDGQQKDMLPGDLVVFSAKQKKLIKDTKVKRTELHTSWQRGTLLFENIKLKEAMEEIQNIYGLTISFQNQSIANRNVHTGIPTKNLEICIKAFEKALELKIEVKDKHLLIKE